MYWIHMYMTQHEKGMQWEILGELKNININLFQFLQLNSNIFLNLVTVSL